MDPVTTPMLKKYIGVMQFSGLTMPLGVDAFLAASSAMRAIVPQPLGDDVMAKSKPLAAQQTLQNGRLRETSETASYSNPKRVGPTK